MSPRLKRHFSEMFIAAKSKDPKVKKATNLKKKLVGSVLLPLSKHLHYWVIIKPKFPQTKFSNFLFHRTAEESICHTTKIDLHITCLFYTCSFYIRLLYSQKYAEELERIPGTKIIPEFTLRDGKIYVQENHQIMIKCDWAAIITQMQKGKYFLINSHNMTIFSKNPAVNSYPCTFHQQYLYFVACVSKTFYQLQSAIQLSFK